MTQTTPVEFRVTAMEHLPDSGSLLAVADVEAVIGGVPILIQGLQVHRRQSDGRLTCSLPQKKHPRTGKWLSAVVLPPELSQAIGDEVVATIRESSP